MNINEKKESVKQIREKFESSRAFFITYNHGLKTDEMTALRRKLKENQGELKVVKNTLIRRAIEDLEYEKDIVNEFTGPVVMAFSYDDPVPIAKAVLQVVGGKKLEVKTGILGTSRLTADEIIQLSKLPGREELIAKVVRTICAPLQNFMSVLTAIPRDFLNVLTAIKDKK